jgi:hypothetical protein
MTDTDTECLTEHHLVLFGSIVQWFARYEWLIERLMARVAGSDTASICTLTSGRDFTAKRAVLCELLRHRGVAFDHVDRINAFLTVTRTYTPLLNDILHSIWLPGKPAKSIQPEWILRTPRSIRPLHAGEDTPPGEFVEGGDDRVSYTLDDLQHIAKTLAGNHEQFAAYLQTADLLPETGH